MTISEELIREGLVEQVPADLLTARGWLEAAGRHLEAARAIADLDPAGAYSLTHDAARKAVAAMMLAEGLRTRAVPDSHRAVARFAESIGGDEREALSLGRLDAMRRNRNRSEYGTRVFGSAEVTADLEYARRIVEIARRRIASR